MTWVKKVPGTNPIIKEWPVLGRALTSRLWQPWPPAEVRFALALGGYFAWLLSFPFFGPALGALAALRGVNVGNLVEASFSPMPWGW